MTPLSRRWRFSLQFKIVAILIGVIVPTFLVVTIAENQVLKPFLYEDLRQVGLSSGKSLSIQISSELLLEPKLKIDRIEDKIQEQVYLQPDVVRIDVFVPAGSTGNWSQVASSVEDTTVPSVVELRTSETPFTQIIRAGAQDPYWEILVPVFARTSGKQSVLPKGGRLIGMVRLWISLRIVDRLIDKIWQLTGIAAFLSVVFLVTGLSYFLRKTIENDRKLFLVQNENQDLVRRLSETQRQLLTSEKLAAMGQLTASFAHEIGTPLNATSGHVQLLSDEIESLWGRELGVDTKKTLKAKMQGRLEIILSQLQKIEQIVKSFLQHTQFPPPQRQQLLFGESILRKTLELVRPQADSLQVEVKEELSADPMLLRVVPVEIEQVFLNLLNNSIDSLKEKNEMQTAAMGLLSVRSEYRVQDGNRWVCFSFEDTGMGIGKEHLSQVFKPFYTTKSKRGGTGLGLSICRQIVEKYQGRLTMDSKEGHWTRVKVELPVV